MEYWALPLIRTTLAAYSLVSAAAELASAKAMPQTNKLLIKL